MPDIRYTEEHEWVRPDGDNAAVGISNHAQEQLGDIVFVELPEVGSTLSRGGAMAVVESVKAASDVYAPISGEVVEVNDALNDNPALINGDAEGEGWFCKIRIAQRAEIDALMDTAAYAAFVDSQS